MIVMDVIYFHLTGSYTYKAIALSQNKSINFESTLYYDRLYKGSLLRNTF